MIPLTRQNAECCIRRGADGVKKKKMMHCVKNVASFFSQGTRLAEAESLPLTWSQTSLVAFHLPLLNYRYQVPLTWARMLLSVDCLAASKLNCQTQVGREFILCHVCLTLFSSYYFERGFLDFRASILCKRLRGNGIVMLRAIRDGCWFQLVPLMLHHESHKEVKGRLTWRTPQNRAVYEVHPS